MKRVVYIESSPNQDIREKLVEIENGKIVSETPWKQSSPTIVDSKNEQLYMKNLLCHLSENS